MDALVVETVPAVPCVLAVTVQVLLAVVDEDVVLAGNVEDAPGFGAFEDLFDRVEFGRLGVLCEVAGVKEERGRRAAR